MLQAVIADGFAARPGIGPPCEATRGRGTVVWATSCSIAWRTAQARFPRHISLGCYADVVNDLAKKRTKFPSHEAAVDAVTKRVGLAPDAWMQRYIDLLDKSKRRDTNGWHTATKSLPLRLDPQAHPCHSSFPNEISKRSYPEVGKHPSSEIIT